MHVDPEDAPRTYQLLGIEIPDGVAIHEPELLEGWVRDLVLTQSVGSRFIAAGLAPVMQVPSAIIPFAWNYLLNPVLLDASEIRIVSVTEHPIDPRLIG